MNEISKLKNLIISLYLHFLPVFLSIQVFFLHFLDSLLVSSLDIILSILANINAQDYPWERMK